MKDGGTGEWRDVDVPRSIRAVVLLNLQSYGGGRDIWGLAGKAGSSKGFASPIFDDGLIEVVGFRSGWHTAVVMGQVSSRIHGTRLAQGSEVEMELAAAGRCAGREGSSSLGCSCFGGEGRAAGKGRGAAPRGSQPTS